jgi:hypothetical protein
VSCRTAGPLAQFATKFRKVLLTPPVELTAVVGGIEPDRKASLPI